MNVTRERTRIRKYVNIKPFLAVLLLGTAAAVLLLGTAGTSIGSSPALAEQSVTDGSPLHPSSVGSSCSRYYVISYIGPYNNPFMPVVERGVNFAGQKFRIPVAFEGPETLSVPDEAALLRSAIASHPCGLAVLLADPTALDAPILQAERDHIPVTLWNVQDFTPHGGPISQLAYVGQDETLSGAKLATHLLPHLYRGEQGVYAVDFAGEIVAQFRYNGIKHTLAQHGISLSELTIGSNPTSEVSTLASYLAGHPKVKFIVSNGAPASVGVVTYIVHNHLAGKYVIASFDMTPTIAQAIKTGVQLFSLDQQPFLQGFYAVANIYFAHEYGFTPVNVNTGTLFVDRSNVNVFMRLTSEGIGA
jgi:simple sugar transport system substrate-binding protein